MAQTDMDGTPERVKMLPVPDWPDDFMDLIGPNDVSLGTEHLPEAVVGTPFALAIWSKTCEDDPRRGGCQAQLSFGDRRNPTDLTDDEIEYINAVLRMFLAKVGNHE